MTMRCGLAGLPAVVDDARCGVACERRARGAGCREGYQPCRDELPLRLPRAHNLHEPPYARTIDRA
jgi:hypothetical protein